MFKRIHNLIHKNRFVDSLAQSYDARTIIFSVVAVFVAIALAIFYIAVYALTQSLWCGAMAFYHIALVLLRGYVLLSYRNAQKAPHYQMRIDCLVLSSNTEIAESYLLP